MQIQCAIVDFYEEDVYLAFLGGVSSAGVGVSLKERLIILVITQIIFKRDC